MLSEIIAQKYFSESILFSNSLGFGSFILRRIIFLLNHKKLRFILKIIKLDKNLLNLELNGADKKKQKEINQAIIQLFKLQKIKKKYKEKYFSLLNKKDFFDLYDIKSKILETNKNIFTIVDWLNRSALDKSNLIAEYSDYDQKIIHEAFCFISAFLESHELAHAMNHVSEERKISITRIDELLENFEYSELAYNKLIFHFSFFTRELLFEYISYKNNLYGFPGVVINLLELITYDYYNFELDGLINLGLVFKKNQTDNVVNYFKNKPCFNSHVAAFSDGIPRLFDEAKKNGAYGSYDNITSILSPHLLEFSLSDLNVNFASYYLGTLPVLYDIHVWWTFNNSFSSPTHEYHRDLNDVGDVTIFTYLTDVLYEDSGGIDFIKGSHSLNVISMLLKKRGISNNDPELYFPGVISDGKASLHKNEYSLLPFKYEELFAGLEKRSLGAAGVAFMADTFGLHRGTYPARAPRLACWIRYGVVRPSVYQMDQTQKINYSMIKDRIPANQKNKHLLRLLVNFES